MTENAPSPAHDPAPDCRGRRFALTAAGFYLLLTLGMFADVLFKTTRVLSAPGQDMTSYNLPLREYAFDAIRSGRLPLWNPHLYAGLPLAANTQAALFYPPNWLHLLLPHVMAINVGIALHFFLAAWFASLWAHARTSCVAASLLAGAVFACCGAYFLHIYPGHVTFLHAIPWAPAIFLCVDRITGWGAAAASTGRARIRWAITLAACAGLCLLAGHPQSAYCIAVGCAAYAIAHINRWRGHVDRLALLATAGILAAGLSAIQLLPSWSLAQESTRSAGLSAETLHQFALPPENLLTVALPHLFGGPGGYVGRWGLSDGSIFVGAVAVVFAAYAGVHVPRARRLLAVAAVMVLLAGVEPSVQSLAASILPGYDTFRAAGRFGVIADLMLAVAAADGLAALMAARRPSQGLVAGTLIAAVLLFAATAWLATSPAAWREILRSFEQSGMSLLPPRAYVDPDLIRNSHHTAWAQLAMTGGALAFAGTLLAVWRRRHAPARAFACALAALAVFETCWFARAERATTPPMPDYPPVWAAAARDATDAGQRVATVPLEFANLGTRYHFDDALGYDPTSLSRYAKYLAVSQGVDWHDLNFIPPFQRPSPLLDPLRIRSVLYFDQSGPRADRTAGDPWPRFKWVHAYQTCTSTEEVFSRLDATPADLSTTVLLESRPTPEPAPGDDGSVRVVAETPERIEIEATTPSPAILVMTDAYAPGWSVTSADGTTSYQLLPADGALRAIPLSAGTHHLLIRYRAPGLAAGTWISLASLVATLATFLRFRKG